MSEWTKVDIRDGDNHVAMSPEAWAYRRRWVADAAAVIRTLADTKPARELSDRLSGFAEELEPLGRKP